MEAQDRFHYEVYDCGTDELICSYACDAISAYDIACQMHYDDARKLAFYRVDNLTGLMVDIREN